ncbi:hypothetical protein D3C72_2146740 [compost metagenome]
MRTSFRSIPDMVSTSARCPIFLSLVRPESSSSPMASMAAVTTEEVEEGLDMGALVICFVRR